MSYIVSLSSFIPPFLVAQVHITGIPRFSDSSSMSIIIPFFSASSQRLRHKTAFFCSERTCRAKDKFLSITVASVTITTQSEF